MKFLFVQKNSFPAAGPMIISALLKQHGFEVDLLLAGEERPILESIERSAPDVIGIPCFTGEHDWTLRLGRAIKRRWPGVLVVLGGPHPTYYPEIIQERGVDIISRGEAEYALLELMQNLRDGKSIDRIKNLWIKKPDGQVIRNELDCLPSELDALPLPDRTIYYKYPFLKRVSVKQFLSGRGCPFQCTFCANNILKKIYQGKGRFVRRRNPQNMIDEIVDVKIRYGLRTASFTDDVFITDVNWLREFLPLYREQVDLPFMCNVTANLITDEIAALLKENCCYGISMGIESGDEQLRREVLGKFISNDQIIRAGKIAKKHGLVLKTYNILCLPEETIDKAIGTMELNAQIGSDFTACSLLQPFPDYAITEYAKNKGFLPQDFSVKDIKGGIYRYSPIQLPDKEQFFNLQKLFFIGVKLPWTIPLIKKLIKFPPNFLFNLAGQAMYGLYMSRVHRMTIADIINYAWHIDPYDV